MYDFERVMISQPCLSIGRLGDNLTVSFNGDLAFRQAQMRDEPCDGQTIGKTVMIFAINDEVHRNSKS